MDKLESMIKKFKKESKQNFLSLKFHENFNSKKEKAKIKRNNLKKSRGKENDNVSRERNN